jgi:chlorophyllide a reductase subunit Y
MGPAGAGSLAQVINTALGNRERFTAMQDFFAGVGTGYAAGVWEDQPEDRPQFKARYARKMAKQAAKRKSSETQDLG